MTTKTSTSKTTTANATAEPTLSPRLEGLRTTYLNGGIVNRDDVLAALAEDYLAPWRAEREAIKRAVAEAERASWTTELAQYIATVLAADESGLFPKATKFVIDPAEVTKGNPYVVLRPGSQVEHSGKGLASGSVNFDFHEVARPNHSRLIEALSAHSRQRVAVYTSKSELGRMAAQFGVTSKAWVVSKPYIERPSAVGLSLEVQQYLTSQHLSPTGTWIDYECDVTVGDSLVIERDDERVVLRGHVSVMPKSSRRPLSNEELTTVVKRFVKGVSDSKAFVPSVGMVETAEVVETKALGQGQKHGLGFAFEVTARGRYA